MTCLPQSVRKKISRDLQVRRVSIDALEKKLSCFDKLASLFARLFFTAQRNWDESYRNVERSSSTQTTSPDQVIARGAQSSNSFSSGYSRQVSLHSGSSQQHSDRSGSSHQHLDHSRSSHQESVLSGSSRQSVRSRSSHRESVHSGSRHEVSFHSGSSHQEPVFSGSRQEQESIHSDHANQSHSESRKRDRSGSGNWQEPEYSGSRIQHGLDSRASSKRQHRLRHDAEPPDPDWANQDRERNLYRSNRREESAYSGSVSHQDPDYSGSRKRPRCVRSPSPPDHNYDDDYEPEDDRYNFMGKTCNTFHNKRLFYRPHWPTQSEGSPDKFIPLNICRTFNASNILPLKSGW